MAFKLKRLAPAAAILADGDLDKPGTTTSEAVVTVNIAMPRHPWPIRPGAERSSGATLEQPQVVGLAEVINVRS